MADITEAQLRALVLRVSNPQLVYNSIAAGGISDAEKATFTRVERSYATNVKRVNAAAQTNTLAASAQADPLAASAKPSTEASEPPTEAQSAPRYALASPQATAPKTALALKEARLSDEERRQKWTMLEEVSFLLSHDGLDRNAWARKQGAESAM